MDEPVTQEEIDYLDQAAAFGDLGPRAGELVGRVINELEEARERLKANRHSPTLGPGRSCCDACDTVTGKAS